MRTTKISDDGLRKAAILVSALDMAAADAVLDQLTPEQAREVRRLVVDCLGREALADAERYLALMGRLTEVLLRFDTARAIVQLKPKQDQARGLLERTRGELAMARLLLRATPRDRERP